MRSPGNISSGSKGIHQQRLTLSLPAVQSYSAGQASAGFPVAVRGLKRCSLAPSYTMPARRDRSTTPAKQEVDIESFDTYELGTSVTVFWTGEKAWYDGVIDSRRKEGGRRGSRTSP